jgi:hypothetical protein
MCRKHDWDKLLVATRLLQCTNNGLLGRLDLRTMIAEFPKSHSVPDVKLIPNLLA